VEIESKKSQKPAQEKTTNVSILEIAETRLCLDIPA
jgi:hypothetical protein